MQPWVRGSSEDRWVLQKAGQQYLICLSAQSPTELDLSAETGSFAVRSVDLKTGAVTDLAERVTAHSKAHLPKPNNSPALLWLVR
jgi:hypothetical protein